MHYPISNFYIRRIRLPATSPLLEPLKEAGYKIEPAIESPAFSVVVEFPISVGQGIRKGMEVSMWEQLGLASFLQRHWADNQVLIIFFFEPQLNLFA